MKKRNNQTAAISVRFIVSRYTLRVIGKEVDYQASVKALEANISRTLKECYPKYKVEVRGTLQPTYAMIRWFPTLLITDNTLSVSHKETFLIKLRQLVDSDYHNRTAYLRYKA